MKELTDIRNEVLNLRNMGELTKQTENILLNKLNALEQAINYAQCSLQLNVKNVTRFEVIDPIGRGYLNLTDKPLGIETRLEDDGRTLKIILDD